MKKRNNPIISILLYAVLLFGLCLMLYPTVSDYWNSMHQSRAIAIYNEAVSSIDDSAYAEMKLAAEAYNAELAAKPTNWTLSEEELMAYNSLLDITGTGVMGCIEVPKLHINLPIYHTTSETVLQVAIGHLPGSSLPVGGLGTHTVLSGHRGLPSAKLFTDLDQLQPGDTFTLNVLGDILTYQVDQIRIVLPYELDELGIEEGQDYCTLVTCTPYGINTHRLLVRGIRIETPKEAIRISEDAVRIEPLVLAPIVAAPILLVLFIGLLVSTGKRKKKKGDTP